MLILELILRLAEFERASLQNPTRCAGIAGVLTTIAAGAAWRTSRLASAETESLNFEEIPSWQLTTLDLPR
jgi:hypothetical protein